MIKQGVVVKSVGGVFSVLEDNDVQTVCFSPKKLRYKDNDIVIGDIVRFESLKNGKGIINDILPRRNKLWRPEVANVDVCFLVLADEPQADFFLADKVLINCFKEKIEPVIVVNKTDLSQETLNAVKRNYGAIADIVSVSAKNFDVEALKPYITGKLVCFAGQSAVGKTSILNALSPLTNGVVGGLSQKSGRGMHTTRHATLHRTCGGLVADTCGFSLCDIKDIRSDELRLYLDDFVSISGACKYPSCTHTVEPECAIRLAVESGQLCTERYERYLEEYKEIKEFEKKQY